MSSPMVPMFVTLVAFGECLNRRMFATGPLSNWRVVGVLTQDLLLRLLAKKGWKGSKETIAILCCRKMLFGCVGWVQKK